MAPRAGLPLHLHLAFALWVVSAIPCTALHALSPERRKSTHSSSPERKKSSHSKARPELKHKSSHALSHGKKKSSRSRVGPEFKQSLDVGWFADRAVDNIAIITVANFAFADAVKSWVAHIERLQLTSIDPKRNLSIVCVDEKLQEALLEVNQSCHLLQRKDKSAGDFSGIAMLRHYVASVLNSHGLDVLYTDVDALWYQNPLPILRAVAPRGVSPGVVAGPASDHYPEVCTGVIFYHGPLSRAFWDSVAEDVFPGGNDQHTFNKMLKRLGIDWSKPVLNLYDYKGRNFTDAAALVGEERATESTNTSGNDNPPSNESSRANASANNASENRSEMGAASRPNGTNTAGDNATNTAAVLLESGNNRTNSSSVSNETRANQTGNSTEDDAANQAQNITEITPGGRNETAALYSGRALHGFANSTVARWPAVNTSAPGNQVAYWEVPGVDINVALLPQFAFPRQCKKLHPKKVVILHCASATGNAGTKVLDPKIKGLTNKRILDQLWQKYRSDDVAELREVTDLEMMLNYLGGDGVLPQ